jgi:hypothetical protein
VNTQKLGSTPAMHTLIMSIDIFEMVAERKLTPEEAADIIVFERELRTSLWVIWFRKVLSYAGVTQW